MNAVAAMRCPHCGQTLGLPFGLEVSDSERAMLLTLLAHGRSYGRKSRTGKTSFIGRSLSQSELRERLFAHRADGGPLYAQQQMHQLKRSLNRKLRAVGRRISVSNHQRHSRWYLRTVAK